MTTYDEARRDHEYLWGTYAAAKDMTGGYVDQDDLDRLLLNPNKPTARKIYESQIEYWFQVGPDMLGSTDNSWKQDPIVHGIADRHCASTELLEA